MQGLSASTKEYCTSIVGVSLLADILPDLPLPTHISTLLESTVIGKGELKPETRRVLNNGDPALCMQISKALKLVDTSFLKLKVAPPRQEYRPDITSPVLIKALLNNGFPHPRVSLRKIDLNQFGGSPVHKLSPLCSPSSDTLIPPTSSPYLPNTVTTPCIDQTNIHRVSKRSQSSNNTKKQLITTKNKSGQMIVSIDRTLLQLKSKKQRKSSLTGRRRLVSSSESDGEFKLPIKISRQKLQLQSKSPSSPLAINSNIHTMTSDTNIKRTIEDVPSNVNDFSLAPGIKGDHSKEEGLKKKKKKKERHHLQMDQVHKVNFERYNNLIEHILDQSDHNCLLSRQVISQLLSETAQLKQLRILYRVSTDLLVKVITMMDYHVLDTAALLINDVPDDVNAKLWRERSRERILRSLDAALIILHITTAYNMSNHVHIEESIDQLIANTKYHLENNIYPEFDPVYRAESKDSGTNAKQKRRYTNSNTINKDVLLLYNRLVEVIDTLALLVERQPLTDTTVLKLSSIGILPFFVENISNLQLSSLKLVRTIFSRYEKHRDLIFEDIFASLARLPTTKKNLRNFRLSNGQSIQMLTALILQLLQCIVIQYNEHDNMETTPSDDNQSKVSLDVAVINSYELSLRTGSNFLSTFMRKCCSGKDEDDFRPLFDNFVQDLLTTLSVPEWPASEVLLTLMGVLLVQSFSNRNNEQQLRLMSLEHLGLIAARLRKDTVTSVRENHEQLVDILSQVLQSKLDSTSPLQSPTDLQKLDAFSENARHLQKVLIAFLSHHTEADSSYAFARNFYLGQWLRDNQMELERSLQNCSSPTSNNTLSDDEDINTGTSLNPSLQLVQQAESNKQFLLSLSKLMTSSTISPLASVLDDKRAVLVTQYLASSRTLSKSFDMYLQKLLRVLNESAVHVRTRAMKTLSIIVAADPSILSRTEVQRAVHYRFSDSSTLMREAAVDLIGRFVLIQPDLTPSYYQMLLERIRDTGVSVRRRVIKILKDICINQPDFDKITDICVNMIRRINDEEGIKQVVTSVFHQLWFTKPTITNHELISQHVIHITEVVSTSTNEQECFEHLLEELLKDGNDKASIMKVCQLMVDSLIERVLYLDEASDEQKSSSKQLVNCMTTLYLFSKTKPSFLIQHAKTLLPYLSSKCTTQEDNLTIHFVARILETVVPLIERPSNSFLVSLEEDLIKLIMKQGAMIVQSCVGCLAHVVNKVTKNYTLVIDCYNKFYSYLEKFQLLYTKDPNSPQLVTVKPSVLRSTFTVGLFCKYFDIDKIITDNKDELMSRRVYSLLLSFCGHSDDEIKIKSLIGFGFFCINYPEMMLDKTAKELYLSWLAKGASLKLKLQVMKNLQTHLVEVESTLKKADANRQKEGGEESLMELGDRHSSVSSNIAQLYLPYILETFYTTESKIRLCVVQSVLLILRQGLVHPGQSVAHLIAMSTDPETEIRIKADLQLSEYSGRFGGFMQTHLVNGLKKAYEFQQLIADSVPRGCGDVPNGGGSTSLLSHLYTLVRSSKPQRRAFLKAVLKPFEDFDKTPLGMLLFLADNISGFPYSVIEEPLFVIHHIDMILSISGASVLQSFREALGKSGTAAADDEEEDELQLSQENESLNLNQLNDCCLMSLGCVLLLILKQYIIYSYNLSDKKCQEYSPSSNNKMWEKAVSRRHGKYFPKEVIDEVERELSGITKKRSKEDSIRLYSHFKSLMNRLDPFDGHDDDDDNKDIFIQSTPQKQRSVSIEPQTVTEPLPSSTRKRSRSRTSSISSVSSNKKKKKRRNSISNNEEQNPSKRKRYNIFSDSDDDSDF